MIFKLVYVVVSMLGLCMAEEIFEGKRVQEFLRETVVADSAGNYSLSETLIKTWYESESNAAVKFYPGMVSQDCLRCICLQESGCMNVGCKMDVGSLSCGYFQIKQAYWSDCDKPGKDWKSCAEDKMCASECVQNYMNRYAKRAKCPLKCEGFAREHNGGPNGCNNINTLPYWRALQKLPHCHNVQ